MNLAVIPARGVSKHIPRRNIMPLCGKPVFVWPIEAARVSSPLDRIIVSNNGDEFARIATSLGGRRSVALPTWAMAAPPHDPLSISRSPGASDAWANL